MKIIRLGTNVDGQPATLDLARLIESRMLVQANSGGGKSFLLRRLLEQTHGHVQQLVLDLEGEFHTLREKFGYVLVAKSGGDVTADPRYAGQLARRLLELGASAIIDLSELKEHERMRFVKLFLEALIDAPRELWHPVMVVIDEAHKYCPEKDQAESRAAVVDLMTRGRKRGLCGVLATQRLSKLGKDAAAEANVKLIGRAAQDVDMKRAADELGFISAEQRLALRRLPPGRFFAFGPGLSGEVVEIQVDDVQTSHPKIGHRAAPVPPPPAQIRKALEQLADLPKEAEAEQKSLADLRAELASVKRQLAAKPAAAAPPAPKPQIVEKRVEVQIFEPEELKKFRSLARFAMKAADDLKCLEEGLCIAIRKLSPKFVPVASLPVEVRRPAVAVVPRVAAAAIQKDSDLNSPEVHLKSGAKRMLQLLAAFAPGTMTQAQVATAAKMAVTGGTFSAYWSQLVRNQFIVEQGRDEWTVTDAGMAKAGADFERMPEDLPGRMDFWKRRLKDGCQRMLDVVAQFKDDGVSRGALAAELSMAESGGTFSAYLGILRRNRLIEEKDGVLKLHAWLVNGAA